MVQLGNWLNLSLNVAYARGHDGTSGAAALQRRNAEDAPSYASDLGRLHHTVRRARSVIQGRDTSIPITESEVGNVLAKIQELERQVQALMQGADVDDEDGDEDGDDDQQDCDAENLMFDLGARAVVDANGQSAAKGVSPPSDKSVGDGNGDDDEDDDSDSESDSDSDAVSKPAPDSAPPAQQKNVVMGYSSAVSATLHTSIPTVASSEEVIPSPYTQQSVEVHTISGHVLTTTVMRMTTRRFTVHVTAFSKHSSSTAVALTPLPSSFVTSTRGKTSTVPRLGTFRKFVGNSNNSSKYTTVDTSLYSSSLSPVTLNTTHQTTTKPTSTANSVINHGHATDLPLNKTLPGNSTTNAPGPNHPDAKRKFASPKIKFLTMDIIPIPSMPSSVSTTAHVTTHVTATPSSTMSRAVNASTFEPRGRFQTVYRRLI
ncbi:hypothetical protein E4U55_001448 [Claviceps digitariae]|nr:hypothetical protein E4U55_001448 [Claviceps digitariae]